MSAVSAQAEHSPFIKQLLGPLADAVEPSRTSPYAALADQWLAYGVDLVATDIEQAIEALATAYNFGSDEAMGWLGAVLVHHAMNLPAAEGRPVALEGLGWLHVATLAGHAFASDRLADACAALPASLVEEWLALPLYHVATVH